jgi:hypothetical protein
MLHGLAEALTPPPILVNNMIFGYHTTILIQVAQKLDIPDKLGAGNCCPRLNCEIHRTDIAHIDLPFAAGPMSAAEIAAAVKSEVSIVERLLYACAANGLFQLTFPAGDGTPRFVNSAKSAVLRKDHPNSQWAMAGHNAEDALAAWAKLPEVFANPSGPIAWDLAYPDYTTKKGGIWSLYETFPERERQFSAAMTSLDSLGATAMVRMRAAFALSYMALDIFIMAMTLFKFYEPWQVEDGPFAKFAGKTVYDVGGSRGHFLHRILETYPAISKGVVVDRPPVVRLAQQAYSTGGPFHSAAGRVGFVGGSFFDDGVVPAAKDGDAYLMRYIIHDW